jgi:hypothetical protein
MAKLSKLGKKSKRKWSSNRINEALVKVPETPLQKYYERATECANIQYQEGISLSSRYCNCRTCLICSAIRTAKYLNHYSSQMLAFKEPVLLTLTKPTTWCISAENLRSEIELMLSTWRLIYAQARKAKARRLGVSLKGLRSLEVTIRPENFYHGHFHISVDGFSNAEWIKEQWLIHYPEAAPFLQHITPITGKEGLLEVIKYATKFIGEETVEIEEIDADGVVRKVMMKVRKREDPVRTDLIIRAMRGKQLISPFGGLKKLEIDDVNKVVQSVPYEELKDAEYRVWRWRGHDWYSHDEEHAKLTTFEPSEAMRKIFE